MYRASSKFAVIACALALALSLTACSGSSATGGGTTGSTDVAATVNGKSITLGEVDRIVGQQTRGGAALSTLQEAAARLTVLDSLIQRQVLVDRAEKEKIAPTDDEINNVINAQKQRFTVEEWEKFLKENNLTEQQVREEARKDLAINKLQEKIYGQITIRDQEITDFFNSNKEQFVNPRGVFIANVMADPTDYAGQIQDDAKSDAEAAAKIQRLHAQLKTGADFATVARASSEHPSSVQGGNIGFANEDTLKQNGFPPDLIARFFNTMNVGDITEPIKFPNGAWYIFKLTDRQLETKPLTLEDAGVRERIRQGLVEQRKSVLNEALLRNAMSDATIVNNLAQEMLKDPNMLGRLKQVTPGGAPASPAATATPAATASPAASPAATAQGTK